MKITIKEFCILTLISLVLLITINVVFETSLNLFQTYLLCLAVGLLRYYLHIKKYNSYRGWL